MFTSFHLVGEREREKASTSEVYIIIFFFSGEKCKGMKCYQIEKENSERLLFKFSI